MTKNVTIRKGDGIGHFAAVAIILATACQEGTAQTTSNPLTDSTPILGIVRPDQADSAWAWDIKCSGATVLDSFPLSRVHWFVGDLIAHSKLHNVVGFWAHPDTIILDIRFAGDFTTTAHELMHYLKQEGGHPLVPWEFPCKLLNDSELPPVH